MTAKYHKRAHRIAKEMVRAWGISYRQCLEEAYRTDLILRMAKELAA